MFIDHKNLLNKILIKLMSINIKKDLFRLQIKQITVICKSPFFIFIICAYSYLFIFKILTMKNSINFTDYLNSCLKKEPSLKSTTHLRVGINLNSFNTNRKSKNHGRTKTDDVCLPQTMSTTSVFVQGKLKTIYQDKKQRNKTSSDADLKKVTSYKLFQPTNHNQLKSLSTYKSSISSKESKAQVYTVKSIQKLRKDILNKTNPEVVHSQLKQINSNDRKNNQYGSITNQYYLLSNDLLQLMKKIKHRHNRQMLNQKEQQQKREKKIIQKVIELQKKNQRYSALINEIRKRNVDVDTIWQQQNISLKVNDIFEKK